jgi:hypothetical protein
LQNAREKFAENRFSFATEMRLRHLEGCCRCVAMVESELGAASMRARPALELFSMV